MKVKVNITKKNLICAAVVAVITIGARIFSGISIFNVFLFILSYLFVKNLEVELSEKLSGLYTAAAMVAGSVITTYLMQYLLLVEDLRSRISNEKMFLNICSTLIVYLFIQACTNNAGLTCIISHILLIVFAGANYFVYAFRGNELTFGDLKSVFTGLSVASNYRFSLNAQAMNTVLVTVVLVAAARKIKVKCKYHWVMRALCISLAILSFFYVTNKTTGTMTETWEQKGTYRNGYLLNFILSIRDSFIDKPEGYTEEAIAALEKTYAKENETDAAEKPTIIAIMNESFADFRVIGNLETNQEVMPFYDSLTENTTKGYALSSVFGAKTPDSEWEFLTGNSMAFLPAGSVPYQQYVSEKNAYSLVDILKQQDYTCVAMHPYYATGWSRDKVYPELGFDEMYFLDDFDQSNLMRKYVSDSTMYQKLISRYEEGKGKENLFLMGITMQNHGGYTDTYDNFNADVYGTNIRYFDVNQYLSLAHQSDLALEELITYFSNVDEPVAICFFGDHQPSLNTSFYRRLNRKGLSGLTLEELEALFEVPYFIWTNYESESSEGEMASLNFLSTMLLEKAGIDLPSYQSFLKDLKEVIPAMNARGYYSKTLDEYVHYGDGTAEEDEWLKKYQILQYNDLFDNKNRSQVFFRTQKAGKK